MRSIEKAIKQYYQIANENTGKAAFYQSDIDQVYKRAKDPFNWICDALAAGFAIGYRAAIRDTKKKALAESGR